MTGAELQICQRVGAIICTFVNRSEQGWHVYMELEKVGLEDLEDQSGKVKTFKSLDTVFEALASMGIESAFVSTANDNPDSASGENQARSMEEGFKGATQEAEIGPALAQ